MKPRHLRIIAVVLGVCIAGIAGFVGWRVYEARYWLNHWRDVEAGPASFRIEPVEVTAGSSLTLIGSFSSAYDFGLPTANEAVHVLDREGLDRFLTPDERLRLVPEPVSGFTFPGREGIGCQFMEPLTEGPRTYADRAVILVLSETPPGRYVLRLDRGAYCNGLPTQPVDLPFVVDGLPAD